jgi:signal transduction histidine kinase
MISVDREQMKSALGQLVQNALEAMADTPEKRLNVSSCLDDGRVKVELRDTGRGIPKEKIKNIFDPFFTSKTTGPGLGLTLAMKIIQAHQGNISVESELEKGTCVTVSLPVKHR